MSYFERADIDLSGFGGRLRASRLLKNWNQGDLADACGGCLANNHISKWENGANIPSAQYIVVLAQALGCSTDFLLGHRAAGPDPTEAQIRKALNRDM